MRLIKIVSRPARRLPVASGTDREQARLLFKPTCRESARAAPTTVMARLACAVWAALAIGLGTAHAEVHVGDPFPVLKAAELTGAELPALEGKVVLVDFWASWCAPCKASFPAFARLHTEFGGRGLVIVAISVDEKPAAFTAFVKKQQPPFATLLDGSHKLVETLRVPAMPTSYLIGRDGRLRFVHAGFHGAATEQELHSQIENLLANDAGPKS